jgi:hypothetical protein
MKSKKTTTVRLSEDSFAKLDGAAGRLSISRGAIVDILVRKFADQLDVSFGGQSIGADRPSDHQQAGS